MRALLPGLALVLLASACTSGPAGTPASTNPLLAQVGEALGAEPVDPEVEHLEPPECPPAYDRVLASAAYDGVRVAVDVSSGPCPGRDGGHFACAGVPDLPGHVVELRDCFSRRLDDHRVLVAGRHHVYQESTSRLAVVWWPHHTCVVSSSAHDGPTAEELARVATEIRCE